MAVTSLVWLGIRTPEYAQMVSLCRDVLALEVIHETETATWFRMADGNEVHVDAQSDDDHGFFGSGPVVGFQVDDLTVAWLALAGVGALFGFFVWNFPAGLIFLGDGGAYFLGFYIAELGILLLHRNPTVSPMFPLLLCIYPVFETVFSIYRRRFLRAMPPSMPDGIHLHSLIYRRVMRWAVGNRSAKALTRRNSMTSPYLWLLCMFAAIPSVLFWDNTAVLAVLILVFGVSYVALYWRIVRFKSPRWMVFRR